MNPHPTLLTSFAVITTGIATATTAHAQPEQPDDAAQQTTDALSGENYVFSDIADSPYAENINRLAVRGILTPIEADRFAPLDPVTMDDLVRWYATAYNGLEGVDPTAVIRRGNFLRQIYQGDAGETLTLQEFLHISKNFNATYPLNLKVSRQRTPILDAAYENLLLDEPITRQTAAFFLSVYVLEIVETGPPTREIYEPDLLEEFTKQPSDLYTLSGDITYENHAAMLAPGASITVPGVFQKNRYTEARLRTPSPSITLRFTLRADDGRTITIAELTPSTVATGAPDFTAAANTEEQGLFEPAHTYHHTLGFEWLPDQVTWYHYGEPSRSIPTTQFDISDDTTFDIVIEAIATDTGIESNATPRAEVEFLRLFTPRSAMTQEEIDAMLDGAGRRMLDEPANNTPALTPRQPQSDPTTDAPATDNSVGPRIPPSR